jgi:hypothetical protein
MQSRRRWSVSSQAWNAIQGRSSGPVTPGAAFEIEGAIRVGFADDTDQLRAGLELFGGFLDEQ